MPFWQKIFARPGVIAAATNPSVAAQLRQAGASTVYFDLNLKYRVGTTKKPLDPSLVVARANKLFDAAVASTGCSTPSIAENELNGANLPTPWSLNNAQYRANVLTFLKTLASRGAHPYLLISKAPYSGGEAADWWRQAAASSDLVPEVYFSAPQIYKQGAIAGSRRMRVAMRNAIAAYRAIGIPINRIGIVLGFQVAKGTGGREGLEPAQAWYRVVKWQALAAKQVAKEMRISSIWSWGWGTWAAATNDPDKESAACVYLWARDQALCDGPGSAGQGFNASLSEGQIGLPAGTRCQVARSKITNSQVTGLGRLTGDRDAALSLLFARLIESEKAKIPPTQVISVERSIVALRFGGSRSAYQAALAKAGASVSMARAAIGDELRRLAIGSTLRVTEPSAATIKTYYESQGDLLARLVKVSPTPFWLGGAKRGYALSSLAPSQLFELDKGTKQRLLTTLGTYTVTPLEQAAPLGSIPLPIVRDAVRAVLREYARDDAFTSWTVARQESGLKRALCLRDQMPVPSSLELSAYLPFLALQDAEPAAAVVSESLR